MVELKILAEDSGKKLHRYLRQLLPGLPLSGVHKMIRVGRVKVNGKKVGLDAVLNPGDGVVLFMGDEDYRSLTKPSRKFAGISGDLDVLYEDEGLLVVNKPAGLLTHPDGEEFKDTLISRVHAYLHDRGEIAHGRQFLPAAVNRLDRNTSGAILIGKNAATLRELAAAIRERLIEKTYVAIVWGRVGDGEITAPLTRNDSGGRTVVATLKTHKTAKAAHTKFKTIATNDRFSLIRIWLISGRTHQIRVHLQAIGHPLIGDLKYGGKPAFGLHCHLLHAERITLPDGRSFDAPIPEEFARILEKSGLPRITGR